MASKSKLKIINDPVYGFIKIPSELVYELINHPYLQRLRRIKQLGLTAYVYPGAVHTRFQHAIGAAYLMDMAIQNLRLKDIEITDEEAEASLVAILLHDIGHGPFSHALENSIIYNIRHEELSMHLMKQLNQDFGGALDTAIAIFTGRYKKPFLHQLVSSQLDMDRLDYLVRDSFFTGVAEGVIGAERIIKMLTVVDDQLAVEAKGIYSVEKFLIARRLMYWQVYFHKTVIAAEFLLIKLLQKAKNLVQHGNTLFASDSLGYFLTTIVTSEMLEKNPEAILSQYTMLDDDDIMVAAKQWAKHPDKILSMLALGLINRTLPKTKIQKQPFTQSQLENIRSQVATLFGILHADELEYFVYSDSISNYAYSGEDDKIKVVYNDGSTEDLAGASDIFNVDVLFKTETKYFLCYPKNCEIMV